jgi:hypothetical protein
VLLFALTQPTPRRNLVLIPELAALAGFAIATAAGFLAARIRRERSPEPH